MDTPTKSEHEVRPACVANDNSPAPKLEAPQLPRVNLKEIFHKPELTLAEKFAALGEELARQKRELAEIKAWVTRTEERLNGKKPAAGGSEQ